LPITLTDDGMAAAATIGVRDEQRRNVAELMAVFGRAER
jgi:hypothetical protein